MVSYSFGKVSQTFSGERNPFLLGRLLQLQRSIVCQDSDLPDELLYGRAGYLYALLYLNTEIGPGTVCESAVREVGSPTTPGFRSPLPFGPALRP